MVFLIKCQRQRVQIVGGRQVKNVEFASFTPNNVTINHWFISSLLIMIHGNRKFILQLTVNEFVFNMGKYARNKSWIRSESRFFWSKWRFFWSKYGKFSMNKRKLILVLVTSYSFGVYCIIIWMNKRKLILVWFTSYSFGVYCIIIWSKIEKMWNVLDLLPIMSWLTIDLFQVYSS